jgi:hypothetical protein
MFESMWSSMTSSMQLAEECLKEGSSDGKDTEQPQPLEGLELFAQAIDSSMLYVFISVYNTVVTSLICVKATQHYVVFICFFKYCSEVHWYND